MTPAQPLTSSELARYIGKRVVCDIELPDTDMFLHWVWHHGREIVLTLKLLQDSQEYGNPRNIRPVLRRLSSITEEEAVKCFQLAFLAFGASWLPDQVLIAPEQILVYNSACELYIEATEGKAWVRGKSDRDGFGLATFFNACAVVDFLDEIGIDQRGYIEKGLAVEKTEVEP